MNYLGYAGQMSQMRGLLFDAPTTMTVNSPPAKMKMPIGLWLCRASLNKSWKLSVICCEETQSSRLIYFHLLNLKLQHRSDIGTAGNDIVDTIGFPIPPHMNCAIPMSAWMMRCLTVWRRRLWATLKTWIRKVCMAILKPAIWNVSPNIVTQLLKKSSTKQVHTKVHVSFLTVLNFMYHR